MRLRKPQVYVEKRSGHMSTVIDQLMERNERFAAGFGATAELPMLPRLGTIVVTCPDPRVDPAAILGLEIGDAAVVRVVAGRVAPVVLQQLALLRAVATVEAGTVSGVEVVLMQHTDCGITRLQGPEYRDGLAAFFGCGVDELESRSVGDPYAAVRGDIEILASNPLLPDDLSVTGVVYDVHTGRVDVVERRSPLRGDGGAGA
jgi:carbonic anhydrase